MTTITIRQGDEAGKDARESDKKNEAAIVFIHGFSGDVEGTWGKFPELLAGEDVLSNWDIYAFGYSTSLLPSRRNIWSSPPPIPTLAGQFATSAAESVLKNYDALAILCHSMGGLVAQRAWLDDAKLRKRVSHLIMYGTPSDGLETASSFKFWSRQIRDMGRDSDFIKDLRARRKQLTTSSTLNFRSVGGASDDFVPTNSCIDPFDENVRAVVQGNHLSIVKPQDKNDRSFEIAVNALAGKALEFGVLDAARQAVELNEYGAAIKQYRPNVEDLDDAALVELALALEETGQPEDAMKILDRRQNTGSDPRAVLGGRLKRKWLHHRRKSDAEMAIARYTQAYEMAIAEDDHDQAHYAAINVAFMKIAYGEASSSAWIDGKSWACKALDHAGRAGGSKWTHATTGEALMIMEDLDGSMKAYGGALSSEPTEREVLSMAQQAYHLADLLFPPGKDGSDKAADRLDEVFQRKA